MKLFDDEKYIVTPEKKKETKTRCRDCLWFFEHMFTPKLTYCHKLKPKRPNTYNCLKVKRLDYTCDLYKCKMSGDNEE